MSTCSRAIVELSLPCFKEPEIDGLLGELPDHATISIRGVSGSGKTLVGENILESALEAGQICRYLIVGSQEEGRESLNQATGTGVDFLTHIPNGTIAIDVVDEPGLHSMLYNLVGFRDVDLLLIDSLDSLESVDLTTAEKALFWLGMQHGTSVVCISRVNVGDSRPYADLTIDMARAGGEVESPNADSVISVKTAKKTIERAFLVEGYGFHLWEYK